MRSISVIIIFSVAVFAAEPVDSSANFKLNEIVVTGVRMPVDVVRLPSAVQIVDSLMIDAVGGNSVGEALRTSSGVFMRSYGGGGALQSVSLRGMNPDYSLILVDGIRFSTFQIGTVDLGIFSLHDVERIEVASGGNSASYGADAVGGVVNIITKKPREGFSLHVGSEIGSYGMSSATAGGNYGNGGIFTRAAIRRERARNDYDFRYDDGAVRTTLKRNGADYSLFHSSIASTVVVPDAEFRLSLRYNNADRGQPSPSTSPYQNNEARIHDDDIQVSLLSSVEPDEQIQYSLAASYRTYKQKYVDPSINLSAFYNNIVAQFVPNVQWTVDTDHRLSAGLEMVSASIRSNELKDSRREQFSLFFSSQHTLPAFLQIIVYPSVRYDTFSDVQGDFSPKIGINLSLVREPIVRFRSSYGKNYRVPTFNDLYWTVGGNPDLVPERSNNFDAGFLSALELGGIFEIEANYFSIDTRDKIVWQPAAGNIWSPRNLSRVKSSGVELRFIASLFEKGLTLQYTHQWTQAVKTSADTPNDATMNKYLVYTPKENSVAIVSAVIGNASAAVVHSFTGYRFETQDNDPRFVLSSYVQTDITAGYSIPLPLTTVRIKVSVKNLFNSYYEIISDYPTPLRTWNGGIEFTY